MAYYADTGNSHPPNPVTLQISPIPLFQWYPQSKDILINLSMKCWRTRFETNYSSCTVRSSENICSDQEKGKTGWNSVYHQNWWFSEFHHPPWMLVYFFAGFLWISPCVWPNSGFWCCCFSYFTHNSIIYSTLSSSARLAASPFMWTS
jgi:hypothetical protein